MHEDDRDVVSADIAVDAKASLELNPPARTILLTWSFDSWSSDRVYWNSPSTFTLYTNGEWELFSYFIHNDRQTRAINDSGPTVQFSFVANYQNSSGNVIHTQEYGLYNLGYKDRISNCLARGIDLRAQALAKEIEAGYGNRRLREI